MESGEVIVQPHDSIEHLRRVMTDSGWGQIPVVDPETGKIIGIVTRTDLLKTMTDAAPAPGHQNLAARLEAALPPARLALIKAVAARSHEQHMAVYVVGGFVRDLLLNRPSPDFDVVVEGDAIALANTLVKCYGGRLVAHSRFGTAKWTISEIRQALASTLAPDSAPLDPLDLPDSLDLISARTEFYDYPTALPAVERSSIKLDLHRRDFTINTMALRLDGRHYGELYDYWGGLRDLRRELVRVLHSLSFVDDPTRMMRAVRFEQRFSFRIEERTLQLIAEARELNRQVSGDRLRHELNLILAEQPAIAMLERLHQLNLLSAIHPALAWSGSYAPILKRALFEEIDPGWNLPDRLGNLPLRQGLAFLAWLMEFPLQDGTAIIQRLRLPNDIQDGLVSAKKILEELPGLSDKTPSQVTYRLDEAPAVALFTVSLFPLTEQARQLVDHYRTTWRNTWPVTTGHDLRRMGIQPGPHYRQILGELRTAWLDGKISTEDEEKQLLQDLVQHLIE
jgi:tRNA nucleotidyltransferase (CCA-adding enzyme)